MRSHTQHLVICLSYSMITPYKEPPKARVTYDILLNIARPGKHRNVYWGGMTFSSPYAPI